MIRFDRAAIDAMGKRSRMNFVNSLSGYKSANLVGTADVEGQTNLSIVSSVFHVGANPPLLGLLIRPHTVPRHTLENLVATGYYTLNHVAEPFFARAHATSANHPYGTSEFEICGFTAVRGDRHPAPYVAESPLQIGLSLIEKSVLECNGCELVIGEILEVRLAHDVRADDGKLDLEALDVLAVSGLDEYHATRSLGRLPYASAPRRTRD